MPAGRCCFLLSGVAGIEGVLGSSCDLAENICPVACLTYNVCLSDTLNCEGFVPGDMVLMKVAVW